MNWDKIRDRFSYDGYYKDNYYKYNFSPLIRGGCLAFMIWAGSFYLAILINIVAKNLDL